MTISMPTTPAEAAAMDEATTKRTAAALQRAYAAMVASGVVPVEIVVMDPHRYGADPIALPASIGQYPETKITRSPR